MSKKKKKARKFGHFTKEMSEYIDHDYVDQLDNDAYEWLKEFDRGYYDHNYENNGIFPDEEEAARDANRREYSARNDAYSVARKNGDLKYISTTPEALTEDTSTADIDWEEYYKIHGYELTLEKILGETVGDVKAGVDTRTALLRFYVKREKLRRLHFGDQRVERELKKRGSDED